MAHVITLTDGTTTANLYNVPSGVFPTAWALGSAEQDEDKVGEALDLLIQATSVALLQTEVRKIETLLDAAVRRYRWRVGPKVFLTVQWDGEADAWRSEVTGGRLEVHGAAEQYSRLKIEATLGLNRVPYWEGPETLLSLTNGNGTNNTGLTIYNDGDNTGVSPDKKNNWVEIAAASVTGSLPAPVKIELKNTLGSAHQYYSFRLATNAFAAPATFPHILQAESRTAGGTIVANTNASGGNEVRLSSYTSTQYVDLPLSTTLLQKAAGRWMRLILSLTYGAAITDTIQAQITDSSGSFVLYTGPEVSLRNYTTFMPYIDLGALPFPPGGYDSSWGALQLRLIFRVDGGSTNTTYLDYVQITPLDSYRELSMRSASIANAALIVDNGYDDIAYVETAGARAPYVLPGGEPLMIFPGQLQRVYVLADSVSNYPQKTLSWAVRMWYRPRRLSV